jgi:hypothetical protein
VRYLGSVRYIDHVCIAIAEFLGKLQYNAVQVLVSSRAEAGSRKRDTASSASWLERRVMRVSAIIE